MVRLIDLLPPLLAFLAAFCFLLFDAEIILDKDSYISTFQSITSSSFENLIFQFNGVEVLSGLVFILASFTSLPPEYSIAIIIYFYTYIFFNLFKNDGFLFGCFFLIIFGLYLIDFWLSQLRASLAITALMFILYRIQKPKSIISIIPILFHAQTIIYSVLSLINLDSIKKVTFIIFLTLLLCAQIDNFLSIDIAIVEKINFYFYRDIELGLGSVNSNLILVKALGFCIISLFHIYFFKKYGLSEVVLICSAIVIFTFLEVPTIVGRINSMSAFFEPFIIARHSNLIKILYITFLFIGAFLKWA